MSWINFRMYVPASVPTLNRTSLSSLSDSDIIRNPRYRNNTPYCSDNHRLKCEKGSYIGWDKGIPGCYEFKSFKFIYQGSPACVPRSPLPSAPAPLAPVPSLPPPAAPSQIQSPSIFVPPLSPSIDAIKQPDTVKEPVIQTDSPATLPPVSPPIQAKPVSPVKPPPDLTKSTSKKPVKKKSKKPAKNKSKKPGAKNKKKR